MKQIFFLTSVLLKEDAHFAALLVTFLESLA